MVVAVIFLSLLVSAGLRSTPSVLLVPLEESFGWSRSSISFAAALGIFLYGLVGPFAAAAMEHFGLRRVLGALSLMAVSSAASAYMTEPWHLLLSWGVFSGISSGAVAIVLGATVVNRWFSAHRGLVMGLLTASAATGTLVFLPALAALASSGDWTRVVWAVAAGGPGAAGLVAGAGPARAGRTGALRQRSRLAAGAGRAAHRHDRRHLRCTGPGRAHAHVLVPVRHVLHLRLHHQRPGRHAPDRALRRSWHAEVQAAGLLALMGVFDLVGTTASGWLTDRYDPRKLLFVYYGLRGLSLIYLPYSDFSFYSLSIFAIFFGLDWIATVPPTLRLTTEAFGERDASIVFGWIVAGHQLGAASAAWMAGFVRQSQGSYLTAFVLAGMTGIIAAFIALMIGRRRIATAPA